MDDCIYYGPPNSPEYGELLAIFDNVTFVFNIPTSPEKRVEPCTQLRYLGFTIDTIKQDVRVPQDKLLEVQKKVKHALRHENNKITLRDLQSLIGSLQWVCHAVAPCRAFIRCLSFLTFNLREPWHRVRLHKGAIADLHMWLTCLNE